MEVPPAPPTTPSRSSVPTVAQAPAVETRAALRRRLPAPTAAAPQSRSGQAGRSGQADLSLAAVLHDHIRDYSELKQLKDQIQCYKTGVFPWPTWLAYHKGTCPCCWGSFPKFGIVTKHSAVPALVVVHAICVNGPLPSCTDCGEEAADNGRGYRKVRNQNAVRCTRCAAAARSSREA